MDAQFKFASKRDFWLGVGATLIVGLLVTIGVPNLLRPRLEQFDSSGFFSTTSFGKAQSVSLISSASNQDNEQRVIRTASMDMLVTNPKQTSEQIGQVVREAGGFLVSSELNGAENASTASLTVRLPADKFEHLRSEIRKFGREVDNEKFEAQDVTKQYIDQAARLRNLRAQEQQYLEILKQAKTVRDTVEVSDKLNDVRSQIEQQQAEFDFLSKQVETVAMTISLRAEAEAQVFGLRWRPLYQLKLALRGGIDGIGDYAAAMAWFVFYIPAILLWLATILIGIAVAWRVFRWSGRVLFARKMA